MKIPPRPPSPFVRGETASTTSPAATATTGTTSVHANGDDARSTATASDNRGVTFAAPSSSFAGVAVRGVELMLDAAKHGTRQGRLWWSVTPPAGNAPSRAITPDLRAHAVARRALHAGDVAGAWRALAESGDAFARLVASTLHGAPTSTYAQITDAHWQRLTGQGVSGASMTGATPETPAPPLSSAGTATYRDLAADLARDYLQHVSKHGTLPSTEDIERMDRANVEGRGLSPLLAIGAMQSKLAYDLDSDYSWGRPMGLPPERVAHRSTVFADVTFDATAELTKTAHAAVMKYGLNKALTLDGAFATVRGLRAGGALAVAPVVVARARKLAEQGDIAGAWHELARHGDDYATSAAKIISQKEKPKDLLACIVDAHWRRIVGGEVKAAKFDAVAVRHLANYLAILDETDGRLPDTRAIERSYRDAVVAEGLPPLVAIDALLSRADTALPESWVANLGVREFSWGAMCGMPPERITYRSDVFADLDIEPATELGATTLATLRRHPIAFLRPANFAYTWNALREMF